MCKDKNIFNFCIFESFSFGVGIFIFTDFTFISFYTKLPTHKCSYRFPHRQGYSGFVIVAVRTRRGGPALVVEQRNPFRLSLKHTVQAYQVIDV